MFEKFTGVSQSFKPIVSITKTGLISFNKGAYNRYSMQNVEYAVLYYDSETHTVAIMLTHDEVEGTVKLRKRTNGADISAVSFLDYYGIDYAETRQYQSQTKHIETADGSIGAIVVENVKVKEVPF